jgi:predicted PurR-regulated permease PerM
VQKAAAESVGKSKPAKDVVHVQVEEPVFQASDLVVTGSWSLLSMVGSLVIVVFLTYFLLLTDDLFKRKLVELSGPTLSKKKLTVQMLDEIAAQIERFLLVQVFTSCIVGVVTWLALWWIGLRDAAFWGFVAGLLNSIPYFGPVIVTAGLSVVALMQFGTLYMAGLVGFVALAITTAEGWLLTPLLLSRASQMNQVAIFAGLLFWSWAWGIWGMLLAVPMLMVLKAVCDRIDTLQPIGKFLGE